MLKKALILKFLVRTTWIFVGVFGMIHATSAVFAETAPKLYEAKGKRDPFVPLIAGGAKPVGTLIGIESADDLVLEGVAYDPKGSLVMVNGSMLKEGETSGNVRVVRVEESRVTFEVNGVESIKEVYPTGGNQ